MRKRQTPWVTAGLCVLLLLAAGGCGAAQGGDYGGRHPKRIAALRGYPVVANVWASWCGPCRFEFPVLQKLSARYGKRVAFIGIDSDDSDNAARTFLGEAPVPYPSYTDPDKEIAESIGASHGYPDTAFYDRSGKLIYLKQGPYAHDSELEADVRRYALGS